MSDDTGLPGRPTTRSAPRRPLISGFARAHRDLPERQLHALLRKHGRDEIVIADRRAADRHQDIRRFRPLDVLDQARLRIAGDAELDHLGADAVHQRADPEMVRRYDLADAGCFAGSDEFVAGRQNCDLRPSPDGDVAVPHGGGEGEFARAEAAADVEKLHAGAEIAAARANVAEIDFVALDDDGIAVAGGVFLDDDAVGAFGHGCAGEDAHGLAGADATSERVPGGGFADQLEARRQRRGIGGAHRVAVHGRGVEGRLRQARRKRLGENASVGGSNRNALRAERLCVSQQQRQRLVDR